MFQSHLYVITGFLQDRGSRSGLVDLWAKLHAEHAGRNTTVRLCPWNAQWDAEAEFLLRISEPNPTVGVVAFSWGAGWGFVHLAKQLRKRGLAIRHGCLIDPVYRHRYILGNWRAFVPGIPILIPRNVERVTWWRQNQTWPRGHQLLGFGKTRIENPGIEDVGHVFMDDHAPILEVCRDKMEALVET